MKSKKILLIPFYFGASLLFLSFQYDTKSNRLDESKRQIFLNNNCDSVYIKSENGSYKSVVFNSFCFYKQYSWNLIKEPWNPSTAEINNLEEKQLEILAATVLNDVNFYWRQHMGGIDSSGDSLIITRLIYFNESNNFLKDYFYSRFLYIYDSGNDFITTVYSSRQNDFIQKY